MVYLKEAIRVRNFVVSRILSEYSSYTRSHKATFIKDVINRGGRGGLAKIDVCRRGGREGSSKNRRL